MKFLRSNPLSRAHLLMPIFLISFLTFSLARTIFDLPYSVDLNSKTLTSSPSSHLRFGLFSYIAKLSRNDMSTLEQSFRVTFAWRPIGRETLGFKVGGYGWGRSSLLLISAKCLRCPRGSGMRSCEELMISVSRILQKQLVMGNHFCQPLNVRFAVLRR
jgi:hypothetical protein